MKKTMSVLLALGFLVTLPASAAARKPASPPGQEPVIGLTCEQRTFENPQLWQIGSAESDFELILDADHPAACFDVVSQEGTWGIGIDAVSVASLQVQLKDSIPGDFCYRESFGKKTNPIPASPWTIDVESPAAAIDACTPGEVGLAADQDPALVFMVSYTPERKTTGSQVTIAVDIPVAGTPMANLGVSRLIAAPAIALRPGLSCHNGGYPDALAHERLVREPGALRVGRRARGVVVADLAAIGTPLEQGYLGTGDQGASSYPLNRTLIGTPIAPILAAPTSTA